MTLQVKSIRTIISVTSLHVNPVFNVQRFGDLHQNSVSSASKELGSSCSPPNPQNLAHNLIHGGLSINV